MRLREVRLPVLYAVWLLGVLIAPGAIAQSEQAAILGDEELQTLVGPIALYPDSILAHVLPASTAPIDVVEAARYLREHDGKVEEVPMSVAVSVRRAEVS